VCVFFCLFVLCFIAWRCGLHHHGEMVGVHRVVCGLIRFLESEIEGCLELCRGGLLCHLLHDLVQELLHDLLGGKFGLDLDLHLHLDLLDLDLHLLLHLQDGGKASGLAGGESREADRVCGLIAARLAGGGAGAAVVALDAASRACGQCGFLDLRGLLPDVLAAGKPLERLVDLLLHDLRLFHLFHLDLRGLLPDVLAAGKPLQVLGDLLRFDGELVALEPGDEDVNLDLRLLDRRGNGNGNGGGGNDRARSHG